STPSATSASLAARTLSRTAAKMFWSLIGSRRLTQFRGRVKKPRVLHERVAVRHAGDEIGDVARARGRIAAVDDLGPFRRHVVGLFQVAREQRPTEPFALPHAPHDAPLAIHPAAQ